MKYWIAVHYGPSSDRLSVVCGQERTKVEAERQISYYCGFYRGQGHTIFKVELERLHPAEVLEVPMQIAWWVA